MGVEFPFVTIWAWVSLFWLILNYKFYILNVYKAIQIILFSWVVIVFTFCSISPFYISCQVYVLIFLCYIFDAFQSVVTSLAFSLFSICVWWIFSLSIGFWVENSSLSALEKFYSISFQPTWYLTKIHCHSKCFCSILNSIIFLWLLKKIDSLSYIFRSSTIMCSIVDLFGFILFRICSAFLFCRLFMYCQIWELLSLLFCPSRCLITSMLYIFYISYQMYVLIHFSFWGSIDWSFLVYFLSVVYIE